MFSAPNVSYLSFTYIDFNENIEKNKFDLNFAERFFTLNNRSHVDPKSSFTPIGLMLDQCIIDSNDNFSDKNKAETRSWDWWINSHADYLPTKIFRYVFKLDIHEKQARELYLEHDIESLRPHVIGKRVDTITKYAESKEAENIITYEKGKEMLKFESDKIEPFYLYEKDTINCRIL